LSATSSNCSCEHLSFSFRNLLFFDAQFLERLKPSFFFFFSWFPHTVVLFPPPRFFFLIPCVVSVEDLFSKKSPLFPPEHSPLGPGTFSWPMLLRGRFSRLVAGQRWLLQSFFLAGVPGKLNFLGLLGPSPLSGHHLAFCGGLWFPPKVLRRHFSPLNLSSEGFPPLSLSIFFFPFLFVDLGFPLLWKFGPVPLAGESSFCFRPFLRPLLP